MGRFVTRREYIPLDSTARCRFGHPALSRHLCVLHIVPAADGHGKPSSKPDSEALPTGCPTNFGIAIQMAVPITVRYKHEALWS